MNNKPAKKRKPKPDASKIQKTRSPEDRAAARAAYMHREHQPKRRSISVMILAGIIFFAVLAYIVDTVMNLGNRMDVQSESVQIGTVDVPVIFSGIIIRDESVYTAPTSGTVNYTYNDLDRVRTGSLVCRIVDEQASESAAQRLAETERALQRRQEQRSDISAFRKDLENINLQIKNVLDTRGVYALQTDFSDIYEVKDSIVYNLGLRTQIIMSDERGNVSSLMTDHLHHESELHRSSSDIYSQESGVLSYNIDGFERELTTDRLSNISPEQTRMTVDYSRMIRSREVEEGGDVFKILLSNEWYIASYIPMEQVYDWVEGETRTIYLQQGGDFTPVDMRVEQITTGGLEYYVLLKSTKNVLDYMHMRNVRFKTMGSEHTGYKIPSSAIADHTLLKVPKQYMIDDGDLSLIKLNDTTEERVVIMSQYSDSDFYYIFQQPGTIVLHDRIKLPSEPYSIIALTDVQNVKGVYVINRGYAEFKRIYIDPRMPLTGENVVLDPARNPELRQHDRISVDARMITPNQKIAN